MQKLGTAEIERLHYWDSQNVSRVEIADRLRIHRNTVKNHLTGRVAYSPQQIARLAQIAGSKPAAASDRLSIYDAATLLPTQPSPARLHRMISEGLLRTERISGRLYTRLAWVRACARKLFDPGLYYGKESIQAYASRPRELFSALRDRRYESPYLQCTRSAYYPAPAVTHAADRLGIALTVPPYRIKLAVARLESVGVYVL